MIILCKFSIFSFSYRFVSHFLQLMNVGNVVGNSLLSLVKNAKRKRQKKLHNRTGTSLNVFECKWQPKKFNFFPNFFLSPCGWSFSSRRKKSFFRTVYLNTEMCIENVFSLPLSPSQVSSFANFFFFSSWMCVAFANIYVCW